MKTKYFLNAHHQGWPHWPPGPPRPPEAHWQTGPPWPPWPPGPPWPVFSDHLDHLNHPDHLSALAQGIPWPPWQLNHSDNPDRSKINQDNKCRICISLINPMKLFFRNWIWQELIDCEERISKVPLLRKRLVARKAEHQSISISWQMEHLPLNVGSVL